MSITSLEVRRHPLWRAEFATPATPRVLPRHAARRQLAWVVTSLLLLLLIAFAVSRL
jgi:hypothetical protein